MFEVRWEFEARPERLAEFAAAYETDGAWVQLFRHGAGYLGTEVTRLTPTRWITSDRWTSRAAYEAFRAAHAGDYAELDQRCVSLTISERKLDERGD